MKIFVISDIHSNFEALKGFPDFAGGLISEGDIIACLGDIVGYGPNPSECISFVREKCRYVISGNHERMLLDPGQRDYANDRAKRAIEWTEGKLSGDEKKYLAGLPVMEEAQDMYVFAHGSPADPDLYILRRSQAVFAIETLKVMKRSLCFIGHTHIPGIFDEDGGYYYHDNSRIQLDRQKYYLINPGSIGQPRDRDARGSFCMLDEDFGITFYRFEYNVGKVADEIKKEGLPAELGERLYYGV